MGISWTFFFVPPIRTACVDRRPVCIIITRAHPSDYVRSPLMARKITVFVTRPRRRRRRGRFRRTR